MTNFNDTTAGVRSYEQEKAYGVNNARGILIGLAVSAPIWAVIAFSVKGIFGL